jgi:hypothetical protein
MGLVHTQTIGVHICPPDRRKPVVRESSDLRIISMSPMRWLGRPRLVLKTLIATQVHAFWTFGTYMRCFLTKVESRLYEYTICSVCQQYYKM